MLKNFTEKTAALDASEIDYTIFDAINGNVGIFWNANGQNGACAYTQAGECIGEWDVFITGNPDTDAEPTYRYRPATYTDPNLNGEAICTPETRHWTQVR